MDFSHLMSQMGGANGPGTNIGESDSDEEAPQEEHEDCGENCDSHDHQSEDKKPQNLDDLENIEE